MKEVFRSYQATVEQQNFCKRTKSIYESGLKLIQVYMDQNNLVLYDENVGKDFIDNQVLQGNFSAHGLSNLTRTVNLLNDIINNVPFTIRHVAKKTYPLTGVFGKYAELFIKQFSEEFRPATKTLITYLIALSHFTVRMEMDNIGFKELSESVILRFFSSLQNLRERVYVPVRRFLRFLYLENLIEKDLSVRLLSMKSHRAEKVPSFYSKDEIRKMDMAVERNSPAGKRDYAIFLLASRLGMRSSDIRNLQFSNINWDSNVIFLKQQKTKKEIELPLLSNIGEAIIDYIKNGRPQSNEKIIFLRSIAPFTPLTGTAFTNIISRIVYQTDIEIKGRRHGPHSLRSSLATNLLTQGTSLPVISGTLGHSSTESTMIYINVDVEKLLRCSLNVPPVPDNFYMQKGGSFYV